MRQPVIIDVVGDFANEAKEELRSRHSRYGLAVKNLSLGHVDHLLILSRSPLPLGEVIDERAGLRIISIGPTRSLRALARHAVEQVRGSHPRITWIAGTPFREWFACQHANSIQPGKLQIQVHGDFGNLKPLGGGPKSGLRWAVASKSLKSADSIRAVSPMQAASLSKAFEIDNTRVFVAPVPINEHFLRHEPPASSPSGLHKVGFIGRLHMERGIKLWADVAHALHELNPDLEFHVLGDGPDSLFFRKRLENRIPRHRIKFYGALTGSLLVDSVSSLSVVLNTCSVEAYGRSLLESVAVGVPVVTTTSPGSIFVKSTFETAPLYVVDERNLVSSVLWSISHKSPKPDLNLKRQIEYFESENINLLAQSWT